MIYVSPVYPSLIFSSLLFSSLSSSLSLPPPYLPCPKFKTYSIVTSMFLFFFSTWTLGKGEDHSKNTEY